MCTYNLDKRENVSLIILLSASHLNNMYCLQKMKSHAFYFALLSACIIFNCVEDRRHLNKKKRSHAFCFVLCSVCIIFNYVEDRMRFGIKNK